MGWEGCLLSRRKTFYVNNVGAPCVHAQGETWFFIVDNVPTRSHIILMKNNKMRCYPRCFDALLWVYLLAYATCKGHICMPLLCMNTHYSELHYHFLMPVMVGLLADGIFAVVERHWVIYMWSATVLITNKLSLTI